MPINIVFIGWLEHLTTPVINIETQSLTIDELLRSLPNLIGVTGVFDNKITFASSTIILVNDCDITLLNGFRTELMNGDTVTIIPISHGG
jgi:molybdopterin converting factor small subunit